MAKNYSSDNSLTWWIVGFIVVSIVILFGVVLYQNKPFSSKTNREVALACTTEMATQFHIHPHLEIVINGQKQEIPANIGITEGCMNALHTHDDSGQIHVESPEKRDFTLSDFFAVWKKDYNKDQIFNYKADASHVIRETINGKETQDYENTVLRDNDQIIIYYEVRK